MLINHLNTLTDDENKKKSFSVVHFYELEETSEAIEQRRNKNLHTRCVVGERAKIRLTDFDG